MAVNSKSPSSREKKKKKSSNAKLKLKYKIGEHVYATHIGSSVMYKAKVINSRIDTVESKVYYFVHYDGWKKKWDEWICSSRVSEYNKV